MFRARVTEGSLLLPMKSILNEEDKNMIVKDEYSELSVHYVLQVGRI